MQRVKKQLISKHDGFDFSQPMFAALKGLMIEIIPIQFANLTSLPIRGTDYIYVTIIFT